LSKSYDRWHCDVGRITRPDLATVAVSRQGLAQRPARLARGGGSCRRLRGAAVPHKEARPDDQGACRRRHEGEKADLLLAALTTSSVLFSGEGQLVFVVANPDEVVAEGRCPCERPTDAGPRRRTRRRRSLGGRPLVSPHPRRLEARRTMAHHRRTDESEGR